MTSIDRGLTSTSKRDKRFNFDAEVKNGEFDKDGKTPKSLELSNMQSQIIGAPLSDQDKEVRDKILNVEPDWDLLHRKCPDEDIIKMIKGMLKKSPSDRSTIRQVLNSAPMKKFKQKLKDEVRTVFDAQKIDRYKINHHHTNVINKRGILIF